jgi:hypothetical protein
MAQLWDISFTTSKLVGVYNKKGKIVCQKEMNDKIVLTALPRSTAMRYSSCDNFTVEENIPERKRYGVLKASRPVDNDRDKWATPATKKVQKMTLTNTAASKKSERPNRVGAAVSGDMTAAINE